MAGRYERYDEDDFDGRRPPRRPEHPTNAGMIGFIAAMVSLAMLVVVVILYVFLKQEEQLRENIERDRVMYYWFLFLDLMSFFAGLTAAILSGRGLSASNPLHRGWSMLGLLLGILEMVVTVFFGFFMTCAVMLLEIRR